MKPLHRRPVVGLLALALGVAAGGYGLHAVADTFSEPGGVPRLVPFRAHLEQGGVPVTSSVTLTFALYDAPSGGTLLWGPEDHTVTPAGGEIHVMLGQTERLSPSVLEAGDAYVQISVGATVLGRQRLGSVPYALRADNGVPPGTIVPFGGTAVPDGWVLCDGRALDGDDPAYAALYAALGTSWGDGSAGAGATAGVTDFNAPDLRGRFLRGADEGAGRDEQAGVRLPSAPGGSTGDSVGTVQPDSFRTHGHQVSNSSTACSGCGAAQARLNWPSGSDNAVYSYYRYRNGSTYVSPNDSDALRALPSGGSETRPENASVRYIVKL